MPRAVKRVGSSASPMIGLTVPRRCRTWWESDGEASLEESRRNAEWQLTCCELGKMRGRGSAAGIISERRCEVLTRRPARLVLRGPSPFGGFTEGRQGLSVEISSMTRVFQAPFYLIVLFSDGASL